MTACYASTALSESPAFSGQRNECQSANRSALAMVSRRKQIGQTGASHLLRNVTSRFCEAICVDGVVCFDGMKMQGLKGRPPHRGSLIAEQTAPRDPSFRQSALPGVHSWLKTLPNLRHSGCITDLKPS